MNRLTSFVLSLLAILLLTPAASQAARDRKDRVSGEAAVVTTTLPAPKEDVHAALLEALATWKMRKTSIEEGIVKTEWVERHKMDETYRGRIVAEFSTQGYETTLTVRHEKQKKMSDIASPSLGGPSAEWRDWSGDAEIARDVARSVEQALGVDNPGIPVSQLGTGQKGPTVVIDERDCILTPAVGARVADLKVRRRDLVKEIKALDQRILDAAYGGKYDQVKGEVDENRARKSALEGRVTEIDKEILSLVIAD